MSKEKTRVACLLLQENFGDLVESVGCYLLKHGACSLDAIIKGTELTQNQVKKSLCVLIQHQLVFCEQRKGGATGQPSKTILYSTRVDHVLWRARFPRYIHTAKAEFGDVGEVILEDVLHQGHTLMSQCVQRVAERVEEANIIEASKIGDVVKEKFVALVEGHFLERAKPFDQPLVVAAHGAEEAGGITTMALNLRFDLPPAVNAIKYDRRKRKRPADDEDMPQAKKSKKEESKEAVDAGVQWQINFVRFHRYLRDQAVVSAVKEKIDESAALVMRATLTLASVLQTESTMGGASSPELYTLQIADALPRKLKLSRSELDQYLKVLTDDEAQFLNRTGDSGGGSYTISYRHSSELICRAAIESIIKERFGSKCFRVFRLLLMKKMLEQKQVAEMAMIPSKEAKELLYVLMAENYVTLQEIPRTPDYAPSRTFYLFSVNLPHVARMVVERCYKALGNLISRRMAETKDNKRLLERHQMYERQLAEVGAGLQEEMEEVLTPDEREKVATIKRNVAKLEKAELQLDETVEIISNYINFQSTVTTSAAKKKS